MSDRSQFLIPVDMPVVKLECKAAFEALTKKERLYAHYLAQASWNGAMIVLIQTSPESPVIFLLLQRLFRAQPLAELEVAATQKASKEEFQALLVYAAAFYGNMGNYKSFGDTKFVPALPQESFKSIVLSSQAYRADPEGLLALWDACAHRMYSLSQKEKELGLGAKGTTTYFSSNCDQQDAELAQKFLVHKGISGYNTRLFKGGDGNSYEVRLASSQTSDSGSEGAAGLELGTHTFQGKTFKVSRGDYSAIMSRIVQHLQEAKKHAANQHEEQMLANYVTSFSSGSLQAHMDGSRHWIRDKGPVVESYIGFIETYRDPFGVRGEWEGFVAMVNKPMSAKFGALVAGAEELLPLLPWPAAYEKDAFLRPDFTSLDVLAFSTSGIPAGINIPNYDDIRQNEGFKNVSLGNVLSASSGSQLITFLSPQDRELYGRLKGPSFEVQVGLHELLGHGSGKLFTKNQEGQFNFDPTAVTHTETGKKIESWYEPGETWDSKFPVISSSYEECRAECVGIYLCLNKQVLSVFGYEGAAADDIIYINWLNMVRAGLLALEYYTPETGVWRQAHMRARYVILRVLLEAGQGLVRVERTLSPDDGQPDLLISLDRSKIEGVGKPTIAAFLRKLQVYKSTGDFEAGKAMFEFYSTVDDSTQEKLASLRDVVLSRKLPRRVFVQPNTLIPDDDDQVVLCEYDASLEGVILSFVERFQDPQLESIVKELWEKDQVHFIL